MHDAITYAQQRGVLLVAAVGNENQGNDVAPQIPGELEPRGNGRSRD